MPGDFEFKKFSVDMGNNASLIAEFWVIGVLHQLARSHEMNSNANSPLAGYYIGTLMAVFYGGKALGTFASITTIQLGISKRLIHMFFCLLIIMSYVEPRITSKKTALILRGVVGVLTTVSVLMKILEMECYNQSQVNLRRNLVRDKSRRFFETLFFAIFGFGSALVTSYAYKYDYFGVSDGYGVFNLFSFLNIVIYLLFLCAFLDFEPVNIFLYRNLKFFIILLNQK